MSLGDWQNPLIWQIWMPFRGIHRWLLTRGCPPTIRRLRGLTRVVHLTVLIAGLGMIAGVLGAVAVWFSMKAMGPGDDLGLTVFGAILGLCVILPLSRWIGRNWWHAGAGIIVSAAWFGVIDVLHSAFGELVGHGNGSDIVQWGLTTTTWCLGMAVWMVDVRRPQTLLIVAFGGGAGIIATAVKGLADWGERSGMLQRIPFGNHEFLRFLLNFQPILIMLLLLCASLGMRLWIDEWKSVGAERMDEDREDASEELNGELDQGLP